MSRARFHPMAREDMHAGAAYLNEQRHRLGHEFLAEIRSVLRLIKENPFMGAPLRPPVRRFVIDRFPYSIVYEPRPNEIYVFAVVHHRREPDYWHDRLLG